MRLYWDSLLSFSDNGGPKSYNLIKISYKKVQNKTTTVVVFTVSIHIVLSPIYIYIYKNCTFTFTYSKRGTYTWCTPTSVLAQQYAEDRGRPPLYLHGLEPMLSFPLSGKHMTYICTHALILLHNKHITITSIH